MGKSARHDEELRLLLLGVYLQNRPYFPELELQDGVFDLGVRWNFTHTHWLMVAAAAFQQPVYLLNGNNVPVENGLTTAIFTPRLIAHYSLKLMVPLVVSWSREAHGHFEGLYRDPHLQAMQLYQCLPLLDKKDMAVLVNQFGIVPVGSRPLPMIRPAPPVDYVDRRRCSCNLFP